MTPEEFSNSFDTLINAYRAKTNFGDTTSLVDARFTEYEKSLFLTQAQEQVVIELYLGKNNFGGSFEETEELRSNLRGLIKTKKLVERASTIVGTNITLSKYSKLFQLPDDVLFITYESAVLNDEGIGCKNGNTIEVIPVTQDEFHRVMKNPFKWANDRRALRLDYSDTTLEIVSKYKIKDYIIRYISRPDPIILVDLNNTGVSINNKTTISNCNLDPIIHNYILQRAVALAIASIAQNQD